MGAGESRATESVTKEGEPHEAPRAQVPEAADADASALDTGMYAISQSAADPRVARTRAAIREAFATMVCEDEPSRITVGVRERISVLAGMEADEKPRITASSLIEYPFSRKRMQAFSASAAFSS